MGEKGNIRISNNSKMCPENVIRKYNILCPNYIDQSRRLRKIRFYILRHSDWRYTTMWSVMTISAEYKIEPWGMFMYVMHLYSSLDCDPER